jgi:hypothetical protein
MCIHSVICSLHKNRIGVRCATIQRTSLQPTALELSRQSEAICNWHAYVVEQQQHYCHVRSRTCELTCCVWYRTSSSKYASQPIRCHRFGSILDMSIFSITNTTMRSRCIRIVYSASTLTMTPVYVCGVVCRVWRTEPKPIGSTHHLRVGAGVFGQRMLPCKALPTMQGDTDACDSNPTAKPSIVVQSRRHTTSTSIGDLQERAAIDRRDAKRRQGAHAGT